MAISIISIALLVIAACLITINAYPYKLTCDRTMTPGSVIMGSVVKNYNLRSVQVLRNGIMLNPGDQFTPGETLTVQVSTISTTTGLFKFMFEASGGASFQTGNVVCNGRREYNLGDGTLGQTSLLMPMTPNTQVNIWVAWATQFGHVYTSTNFTLINFPSTQQPSLSPDYKSTSPSIKPTKVPTIKVPTVANINPQLHFPNETQQSFTLVLERQVVANTFGRNMVTVNGTVPGPTLRVKVGQWVNIKIINNIGSEMSVIHWHGFDQRSTQWNDGPAGVTQCPINTMNGTNYLSNINTVTEMTYRFFADRTGTYWYHGHYHSQYPEGLYGAIVVEDDAATTSAYAALGATYTQETEIIIADLYQTNTETLLTDNYLLPSSNGLEPVPDYIVVNNMFSKSMQINVNRNQKIRLRAINAAALSMYDISVDGCPLSVIEVDGFPVKPKLFSSIRLDAGQRASFILDWSLCDSKFATSKNIPLKVKSVKEMYRQYDQTDTTNWGLFGSTTKAKYVLTWVGQFTFPSSAEMSYYYYGASIPTPSTAPVPVEPNLLEMTPLFNHPAPPLDLVMDYNITFTTDPSDSVRKFFVNDATPQPANLASPTLYDYMMPQGGPLKEFNLPKYAKITGDGKNPFVIPYNRSVTITVRNGDGAGHPLHLHGHNFWIMATSQYTPTNPIMRDVVSVPAQGWAKIRFVSDNPGVWLAHCHIDWHMYNGFLATMIEAPSKLQNTIANVAPDHKAACSQYFAPTSTPTVTPSNKPMTGTWKPTFLPTKAPTVSPTVGPSAAPVKSFVSTDPYASDWKTYGYDNMRRGFNPTETKISSLTVSKLKMAWRYPLAGGAYMQPIIVLNYDFGNFPNTKYARRNLQATNTYQYLGCYGDKGAPRAFTQRLSGRVASVSACFQLALQNNMNVFGIQYGGECWGSISLQSATQYGQCGPQCTGTTRLCTCTVKCASGENCGGGWSNSVYSIVDASQISSTTSVSPSVAPTVVPNTLSTTSPTVIPTSAPSKPTVIPSQLPSSMPAFVSSFGPTRSPIVPATLISVPTYQYLGCYGDKGAPRAFTQRLSGRVASVSACFQLAQQNNMNVFGIQYGGECWGSISLQSATQYGPCGPQCTGQTRLCSCTVKCASGENCGGGWSNSVYSIVDASQIGSSSSLSSPLVPSFLPSTTPSSSPLIPSLSPTIIPSLVPTGKPILASVSAIDGIPYTYLGCYGDSAVRAMDLVLGNVNSVQGCYALAVNGNYKYFGIQYGGECWASNDYLKTTQYNQCGPTCTGGTQYCTCTMPCLATGENCGGGWSNVVYAVGQINTAVSILSSYVPTTAPSIVPTNVPSAFLTIVPSVTPSILPTNVPSIVPTTVPSVFPTLSPVVSALSQIANLPSNAPLLPSIVPTVSPTQSAVVTPFSYLGCYGDNAARAMTFSFGVVKSVAACYNLASAQKWQYFALQYGGECWVSNSLTSSTTYGKCGPGCTGGIQECTCSAMTCTSGEACGGPYANALYVANTFMTIVESTFSPSVVPTFKPTILTAPTINVPSKPTSYPTLSPGLISQFPSNKPVRAPTSAPVITLVKANFQVSTIRSAAFVGDEKGVFHAVDLATGQAIWTTFLGYFWNPLCGDLTGQNWGMTGSPVFNRTVNTIYVVGGNGSFNALSMKTGQVLWKIENFYDKTALHNYGGLSEYNGIVYATLAGMCDQLLFKGGIFAVNTFTRSVQFYFSPSSNNPNVFTPPQYGGGVWGLSGITIGDPSVSGGSPTIYFNVGNCLGNNGLKEDALYCESIIKTDINLKLLGEIKPPKSAIIGDNDYGSGATFFNSRSDPQTSGCKTPMLASIRKDFLWTIANADTMMTTQTFQIGARDRAQGIQQAVWDSYENLLIMTNQYQGTNQYAGRFPSGVLAFQLNSTCGLNLKWNWVGNPSASVVLVGPPGQRVALAHGGYGGTMLDVKTGVAIRTYNVGGSAASPPAFANGYMVFATNDPANSFAGRLLEAWQCVGC